ncbi:hypothetical protein [Chlamydia avium]|uniref:Uncharacterized protein n=1 Tax=Chlamydia avium 10DC88 TaxID=1229831 RepID=W8JS88_9CHLA|nr:hypothetical protein [Chlamydia avium]AHK63683.1 Uncharacterized protein M832_08340 [Chlamydia avium 10DC88]
MIDPLQIFPKLDSDKEAASIQKPSGTPLASELNKEVPVFSLGTSLDAHHKNIENVKQNPMAMMQDQNSSIIDSELQEALNSEEFEEQVHNLKERLWDAQSTVQNHETNSLSPEHLEAMNIIIDLINEDFVDIAKYTQQDVKKNMDNEKHESVTRKVINWVSSGEEVLNRALLYFSDRNGERESLADFLKVQYAVQRATQRAELFASIVGTTVSSIKTIMTTQLG